MKNPRNPYLDVYKNGRLPLGMVIYKTVDREDLFNYSKKDEENNQ